MAVLLQKVRFGAKPLSSFMQGRADFRSLRKRAPDDISSLAASLSQSTHSILASSSRSRRWIHREQCGRVNSSWVLRVVPSCTHHLPPHPFPSHFTRITNGDIRRWRRYKRMARKNPSQQEHAGCDLNYEQGHDATIPSICIARFYQRAAWASRGPTCHDAYLPWTRADKRGKS